MPREVWYRYDDMLGSAGVYTVYLRTFEVERYTQCGVWLRVSGAADGRKWVSRFAHKRWAYDTLDGARKSYKIRKRRQEQHGQNTVARAQECLAKLEAGDVRQF